MSDTVNQADQVQASAESPQEKTETQEAPKKDNVVQMPDSKKLQADPTPLPQDAVDDKTKVVEQKIEEIRKIVGEMCDKVLAKIDELPDKLPDENKLQLIIAGIVDKILTAQVDEMALGFNIQKMGLKQPYFTFSGDPLSNYGLAAQMQIITDDALRRNFERRWSELARQQMAREQATNPDAGKLKEQLIKPASS